MLLEFEEKENAVVQLKTTLGGDRVRKQRELTIKLSAYYRSGTLIFINNLVSQGAALQFSGKEMEAQSFELLTEGDMVSKYRYLSHMDCTWGTHLLFQLVSDRAKILKSLILESSFCQSTPPLLTSKMFSLDKHREA